MLKLINNVNQSISVFLDVITSVLTVGMTIFLIIQIAARYFFRIGFPWTEEGARLMMVFLVYLGAGMVSVSGVHISVTLLEDMLKGAARKTLLIIQQLIFLTYAGVVVWCAYKAFPIAMLSTTTNTNINNAIILSVIPVSYGVMISAHIVKTVNIWMTKEYKHEDEDQDNLDKLLLDPEEKGDENERKDDK